MSTFVQLYIVLLGFVNFRLYHQLNLNYPPKIGYCKEKDEELVDKSALESERIAALNLPLRHNRGTAEQIDDTEVDNFNMGTEGELSLIEEHLIEMNKIKKLKTLFKGTKIFLNREVPREPLVFILKCFGADVSWSKTLFVGATFDETNETITHQIVDRPIIDKQYISRYYVQPQWVFDSVNARELLPVEKYFIGCVLPPHLSPFVDGESNQVFTPLQNNTDIGKESVVVNNANNINENDINTKDFENGNTDIEEEEIVVHEESSSNEDDKCDEGNLKQKDVKKQILQMKKKMCVSAGKVILEDPQEIQNERLQEFKLKEKMVEKKYRALYKSMRKGQALRRRDVNVLKRKRQLLNEKQNFTQI